MNIGVIIPTRGDRPEFLKQAINLLYRQSVKPTEVLIIDDAPQPGVKDITKRYRIGYDEFRNKNFDVLFFWEDDDYYTPNYIETMLNAWLASGKPDLFGTTYTIYYHIGLQKYFTMNHLERSSAMSTMIKPDMDFNWPIDTEPYTDTHLWMVAKHTKYGLFFNKLKGVVFTPQQHICLGIKHGVGLTGGDMHTTRLHRYDQYGQPDEDHKFLSSVVDTESLEFYKSFNTFGIDGK
jgi:glycosyltransferase involved in cell wall biosynthesis